MKAALVKTFDQAPSYDSLDEPVAGSGEIVIQVSAAALSPLVKGQAAGKHYSSEARFPFVPGIDGVGRTPDGAKIYFAFPRKPYGSMAELTVVDEAYVVAIPNDLDDTLAAAIANPGMSSWAALTRRAKLVVGETVFINGATGTAGSLAVQIAKQLGAKKVIATGRNLAALEVLPALGADLVIPLEQAEGKFADSLREQFAAGVDVVIDYLWGSSAEQIIGTIAGHGAAEGEPRIRYVQVGAASGPTIAMPASALRSSGLEIMGSGLGSISNRELVEVIGELMQVVDSAGLKVDLESVPLPEVELAWTRDSGGKRLVFVP